MIRRILAVVTLVACLPLVGYSQSPPAPRLIGVQMSPMTQLAPVHKPATSVGLLPTRATTRALTADYQGHAPKRQVLARNANGTFWDFTAEQPYHAAAVTVMSGNQGGSGTLVGTTGNVTLMVTNHHVVEHGGTPARTVQVHMRDGRVLTAAYIQATPDQDIAVYRIDRSDLPCVAVCSENAPAGATIDVMGFGGPRHSKGAFRPFHARTVTTSKAIAVDAPCISGDSGSGMIWRGCLVGVNWGADSIPSQRAGVNGGESWPLVYPATSSADAVFLNRYLTQSCGPMGCQPIIGRPGYLIPRGNQSWERQPQQSQGQGQFPGPEQFYRPDSGGSDIGGLTQPQGQPPATQPQYPGQQYPQQQQPPAADPQLPIDGSPVPPMLPGVPPYGAAPPPYTRPGGVQVCPPASCSPCECGDIASEIIKKLKADGTLKGEKGDKGDPGDMGPMGHDGLPGQKGDKGDPGQVTQEHLEKIVVAVTENIGSQKLTQDQIQQVIDALPMRDVVLVDGSTGKELDRETYKPGEPIVLDFQKVINASQQQ